jgi:ATP-dependent metalloprotease
MGIGRKSLTISEKDKLVTAYHEGGHALTSLLTKGATPLHKVTILPRGDALGFVNLLF